jgi:hypothetical protein
MTFGLHEEVAPAVRESGARFRWLPRDGEAVAPT